MPGLGPAAALVGLTLPNRDMSHPYGRRSYVCRRDQRGHSIDYGHADLEDGG